MTVIAFAPNYTIVVDQGTLTITQREIKIVIDDKQKYVGEDDPEFTYTYNEESILDEDKNSVENQLEQLIKLTRVVGEEVGSYEIYAEDNGTFIARIFNIELDEHYYISEIKTGTLEILDKNDDSEGDKLGDEGNKPGDGTSSNDKTSKDVTKDETKGAAGSVQTGDNTNITLYLGLVLASIAAIVAVLFSRKRTK